MSLDKYNDLLSVKDLAEIFGACKGTIYREIHKGTFGKPIKIGKHYKIPRLYIQKYFFHVA